MSFDRGLSIGLFFFSSWALYLAITMEKTAIRQTVGPEVFPIGLTVCMLLASVALFIRTTRVKEAEAGSGELPEGVEREDRRTQFLVLLGIAAYVFALEPLGYILATALLCIYETAMFEAKHWLRNLLSGVGFSVGIYLIFVNVLDVMLPKGLLGW
ncbi:MAG: tripartite tricarboxylate transporter TctB family protein [Sphingomonadaceae bacterium]